MNRGLVAQASITIDAPIDRVWNALVDAAQIKQYMFGSTVVSDWQEGSPIVWRGEWDGKPYEDKGVILKMVPHKMIRFSHYSPLSGQPDVPENYHTLTIELDGDGQQTGVSLSQDGNATEEEREHARQNWAMMLENMKQLLES